MLSRAPGDVGCGHCKRGGATRDCVGCGRVVCEACAADWRTCPEPRARVLRVGLTGRLRAVDADGRLGLVSYWHRAMRVVDLVQGRFVEVPDNMPRSDEFPLSGVTRDGALIAPHYEIRSRSQNNVRVLAGIDIGPLDRRAMTWHLPVEDPLVRLHRVHTVHDDRWVWIPRSDETILLADRDQRRFRSLRPWANQVIQGAAIDAKASLLAAGTYGRVELFRIAGHDLERLGGLSFPGADLEWVGLGGSRLAVIANYRGDTGRELQVFALDGALVPVETPIHRWSAASGVHLQKPPVADMSPDGRCIAVALADARVAVHDPEHGTVQHLAGHTDDISLVRLSRGGRMLITGDYDNRVILRPHGREGFARTMLDEHAVPGEPIPIPPARGE